MDYGTLEKPLEEVEALFLTFCICHTHNLTEAESLARIDLSTLWKKRIKYQIPLPPPGHYTGPALTRETVLAAFYASRVPRVVEPVTPELLAGCIEVRVKPPQGQPLSFPLASPLPTPPSETPQRA